MHQNNLISIPIQVCPDRFNAKSQQPWNGYIPHSLRLSTGLVMKLWSRKAAHDADENGKKQTVSHLNTFISGICNGSLHSVVQI